MKTSALTILALLCTTAPLAAAPLGSAFTYQGSLAKAGAPVNEPQDFQFGLYDSTTGSGQVGSTITLNSVNVTNGLFNVDLDFGPGAFGTEERFLQIMVRPSGGGAYTGLSPRAAVMPAPVALSVAANGVTADSIANGSITREKLAPSVTPKLRMSAFFDLLIFPNPEFPIFFIDEVDGDFFPGPFGVEVGSAGIYMVATHLTITTGLPFSSLNIEITVNGNPVRVLANELNQPVGTTVYSSVELLQLNSGDVLAVQVWDSDFGNSTLEGGPERQSSFDIVRID